MCIRDRKDARAIIERIGELQLEDGVNFKITSVKEIMEEFDYPGIRMMIEANLERMRQPFKIDISTDDAITPGAVAASYTHLFAKAFQFHSAAKTVHHGFVGGLLEHTLSVTKL